MQIHYSYYRAQLILMKGLVLYHFYVIPTVRALRIAWLIIVVNIMMLWGKIFSTVDKKKCLSLGSCGVDNGSKTRTIDLTRQQGRTLVWCCQQTCPLWLGVRTIIKLFREEGALLSSYYWEWGSPAPHQRDEAAQNWELIKSLDNTESRNTIFVLKAIWEAQ